MTERIEIIVTDKGTREVKRNLDDLGNAGKRSGDALSFLRKALLLLGGAAVLKRLIDFVDIFTNMQNRIRNVTRNIAEMNVVTDHLFAIAQRTRSTFEATTEVFTRTALAVKDLGISQAQTLRFTESLNQAVILSGATAQEANAAMIQLSQGLASGTLRGDELRSVLEQLPVVADIIARSLGVTRGELRKLGEEGKLTSDVIIKAFEDSREELAERFAKTVPTIGQAFNTLRNALIKVIGEFDKATGASTSLAKSLIFVADNAEVFGRIMGALALVVGVQFAQVAVQRAIIAVRALTLAIAANPIGAIITAITVAIAALIAFSDQIMLSSESFVTLQDFGIAAFQIIGEYLTDVIRLFKDNFGFLVDLFRSVFGDVQLTFKDVLKAAAFAVDRQIGLWIGLANAIVAAFQNFPRAIQRVFAQAFRAAQTIAEKTLNSIIGALNKLPGVDIELVKFDKVFVEAEGDATKLGERVKDAFLTGFNQNTIGDVLDKTFQRAEQIAKDRLQKQAQDRAAAAQAEAGLGVAGPNKVPLPGSKEVAEHLKLLRQEGELLRLNGLAREQQAEIFKIEKDIRRELTAEEAASVRAIVQENAVLEERARILEDLRGPTEQLVTSQQALQQLLQEGKITAHEYAVAMNNLQLATLQAGTTAADGFRRGFLRIKQDILDVASAVENTLVNAYKSAEDALVEFVTTGEVNVSKLVDSILADLTRLLAKQALLGLLNSLGGGAGGGGGWIGAIAGAIGGARADGGPVPPGRAFLVGERGPEMFVPRQSGTVVPNEAMAAAPAAAPEVNVSVINVDDQEKVPEAMSSQRGDKVILNSITRNRNAIRNALGIA